MLTYMHYLIDQSALFFLCLGAGVIFGLLQSFGETFRDKALLVLVSLFMWVIVLFPVFVQFNYSDYKNHYTTCEKPEAKRAGYVFSGERCWVPTQVGNYVKISDILKTKKDLRNDK